MYENEKIKQVVKSINIVTLVSESVALEKEGDLYWGLCPFHHEKTPSFSVDYKKQEYHCFGCSAGGDVISYVMRKDACSFEAAVSKIASRAGIDSPKNKNEDEIKKKKNRLYLIHELAQEFYQKNGRSESEGMTYLKFERNLTDESIKKFGLGKAPGFGKKLCSFLKSKGFTNQELLASGLVGFGDVYDEHGKKKQDYYDKFWDRVIFPIFNQNNIIIGFGGRVIGKGKPKYMNSPETMIYDKSHELYGLSIAKSQNKSFILCEGYLDVISMHQHGFHTAVASLGTSLTRAQAKKIKEYTNSVYIAYDSDEPGISATIRAIPMLEAAGLKVYVVSTSPYKDVDELLQKDNENSDEMKKRIRNAIPGKTFITSTLNKKDPLFYDKVIDFAL